MSSNAPPNRQTVVLVDAMNYIFRAYYGLPGTITAPSGMKTNAILGYLRTLLRIIKDQNPPFIAAAFEGARSFRREIYSDYKANRSAPPPDLKVQFGYCRQITEAVGVAVFQRETYEADDVIGSLAVQMSGLGHPVVIVSGDKDLAQLVDDRIQIYDLAKNLWLDSDGVKGKMGVRPTQIPDLLALLGDSVDNIPGIHGIGGKTAVKLLSVCETIEDIANSDLAGITFRGRDNILQRLRDNLEAAQTSRDLARIRCDVDLGASPDRIRYRKGRPYQIIPLCKELGFDAILADIPLHYDQPGLFD